MKKNRFDLTLGLLIVFASSLLLPVSAFSQSGTLVGVEPPKLVLSLDQSGTVSVQVEGASEFYGVEIRLGYDPEIIQVLDADPNRSGVQVSAGDLFDEDQGFLVRNQADNQQGEILYAFTLLAPEPPLTGSGTLIEFEVLGVAEGRSDLELEVILASPDGIALPLEEQPGVVTVGTQPAEPGNPPPTSTPLAKTATTEVTSPSTTTTSTPTPTAPPPEAATASATPQFTNALLQTSEATQPQESSPTLTPSTGTGESLVSPDPSDSSPGDTEETAESDTSVSTTNTILWIVGLLALGIGAIIAGLSIYRRGANREE